MAKAAVAAVRNFIGVSSHILRRCNQRLSAARRGKIFAWPVFAQGITLKKWDVFKNTVFSILWIYLSGRQTMLHGSNVRDVARGFARLCGFSHPIRAGHKTRLFEKPWTTRFRNRVPKRL
jgi:hypothetical protein